MPMAEADSPDVSRFLTPEEKAEDLAAMPQADPRWAEEEESDDADRPELTYEDYLEMGIDPRRPTRARPGSEEKIRMLSARYDAGIPLWDTGDNYSHGPSEVELGAANRNQQILSLLPKESTEDEEEPESPKAEPKPVGEDDEDM